MSINIQKSHLLGVGNPDNCVAEAAKSIGCSIMKAPFKYLGILVGTFLIAFKTVIERLLESNGLSELTNDLGCKSSWDDQRGKNCGRADSKEEDQRGKSCGRADSKEDDQRGKICEMPSLSHTLGKL
nr:hypothetical protein [Tanacetum cinerariifolium]